MTWRSVMRALICTCLVPSQVHLRLNGRTLSLAEVSPNVTLLEFLRCRGLTGAQEGCAEGDCGACSAAMVERDANGQPTYLAFNSCLLPVCLLAGGEVMSVEGVDCPANRLFVRICHTPELIIAYPTHAIFPGVANCFSFTNSARL